MPSRKIKKMVTENEIMKMKKDDLKDVILTNGFGEYYKANMLKADLQVLALKSVGLAKEQTMPAPRATPVRSAASTYKRRQSIKPEQQPPDLKPEDGKEDEFTQPPDTPLTRRRAAEAAAAAANTPLPTTPEAAGIGASQEPADQKDVRKEADDSDEEETEGSPRGEPGTLGWSACDSTFWTAVDAVFMVTFFIVVVAVIAGYALSRPGVQDAAIGQWNALKALLRDLRPSS
uniref:Uncharacterized protein n=1 Tax=Tetraselmis sp. GSL018 TaxID=582737 RepID=A0A061SHS3_9CHLO|mmetsp:Transcript_29838/g.71119  ORF Transcript_29838/g.71119 Transcript_29838/m.71119 type:complete len:232 (+) Transcript_29838:331-1026(+)